MKRAVFSSLVLSALTLSATTNAFAETIERPWKDTKGSTSAHSKTIFGKPIVREPTQEPARIYIRKFNTTTAPKPAAPEQIAPKQTAGTTPKNRRKKTVAAKPLEILPAKVRTSRVKRKTRKTRGNAQWWENTGNPAVFAFRDCATNYARQQVKQGIQDTPANIITASMKSSCQLEFAKMAGVLIGGLGEEKSNEVLKELAQTTFLPTVRQAMKKSQTPLPVQAAQLPQSNTTTQAQNRKALIAVAKKQMFNCFIERSDRLSAARSTKANTIASAVIAGCKPQSDMFFDNLFATSKANPQVIEQQKNIALNEVYRQAIIKRVLVTRGKAKLQTATGTPVGSSTIVLPSQ